MSVSAVLDIALGLSFVFLLFSLAVSRINETITTALKLRYKGLASGIAAMVGQGDGLLSVDKVLGHELIQPLQQAAKGFPGVSFMRKSAATATGLQRDASSATRGISYLPARTFSAVVLDLLAPADPAVPDPLAQASTAISGLDPHNPARAPLMRMMTDAQGDRDKFRQSIEHWFDDTMARASGWYKRYVQRIILIISIVLVASLNVDSINIAQVLWRLPTERAAVAAAAASQAGSSSNASQSADSDVQDISALKLPIGWTPSYTKSTPSADPRHVPIGAASWIIKILGLILSVLALSLGAPFWFQALGTIASWRQSGPKPPASATT
jgi:hypothetical protein